MRKYILFFLLIIVLFVNVTDVQAARRCHKVARFPAPVLSSYLSQIDDGGDPLNTYYQAESLYNDYLSDFRWWLVENRMCKGYYSIERFPTELFPIPPME